MRVQAPVVVPAAAAFVILMSVLIYAVAVVSVAVTAPVVLSITAHVCFPVMVAVMVSSVAVIDALLFQFGFHVVKHAVAIPYAVPVLVAMSGHIAANSAVIVAVPFAVLNQHELLCTTRFRLLHFQLPFILKFKNQPPCLFLCRFHAWFMCVVYRRGYVFNWCSRFWFGCGVCSQV